jgi:hypothetical protein
VDLRGSNCGKEVLQVELEHGSPRHVRRGERVDGTMSTKPVCGRVRRNVVQNFPEYPPLRSFETCFRRFNEPHSPALLANDSPAWSTRPLQRIEMLPACHLCASPLKTGQSRDGGIVHVQL